jgi:hypothetical protein
MIATRSATTSDATAAQWAFQRRPPRVTNSVTSGNNAKIALANSELPTGVMSWVYAARVNIRPPPVGASGAVVPLDPDGVTAKRRIRAGIVANVCTECHEAGGRARFREAER